MQLKSRSTGWLFVFLAACAALAIIAAYNFGTRVRDHGALPGQPTGSNPPSALASGDSHPVDNQHERDLQAPNGIRRPASEGNGSQPVQGGEPPKPSVRVSPQSFQEKYGSMTLDQLLEARATSERVLHKKCEEVLDGMLDRGEYEESILSVGEKQPPIKSGLAYRARGTALPGGQTMVHSATIDHSTHTDTAALYAEMIWLGQEIDSRRALAGKTPR